MTFVEITRFRVAPESRGALVAARPAMLRDFSTDRRGFVDAQLIELRSGEWLDVVRWRSREDFVTSREKGANHPGIAAFFSAIDDVIETVEGEEPDLPADPRL